MNIIRRLIRLWRLREFTDGAEFFVKLCCVGTKNKGYEDKCFGCEKEEMCRAYTRATAKKEG